MALHIAVAVERMTLGATKLTTHSGDDAMGVQVTFKAFAAAAIGFMLSYAAL